MQASTIAPSPEKEANPIHPGVGPIGAARNRAAPGGGGLGASVHLRQPFSIAKGGTRSENSARVSEAAVITASETEDRSSVAMIHSSSSPRPGGSAANPVTSQRLSSAFEKGMPRTNLPSRNSAIMRQGEISTVS